MPAISRPSVPCVQLTEDSQDLSGEEIMRPALGWAGKPYISTILGLIFPALLRYQFRFRPKYSRTQCLPRPLLCLLYCQFSDLISVSTLDFLFIFPLYSPCIYLNTAVALLGTFSLFIFWSSIALRACSLSPALRIVARP